MITAKQSSKLKVADLLMDVRKMLISISSSIIFNDGQSKRIRELTYIIDELFTEIIPND